MGKQLRQSQHTYIFSINGALLQYIALFHIKPHTMDDLAGQLMINTLFIAFNIISIISFLENGKRGAWLVNNMFYIIDNRVISDHNVSNCDSQYIFTNNFENELWHFENVITTCTTYTSFELNRNSKMWSIQLSRYTYL